MTIVAPDLPYKEYVIMASIRVEEEEEEEDGGCQVDWMEILYIP